MLTLTRWDVSGRADSRVVLLQWALVQRHSLPAVAPTPREIQQSTGDSDRGKGGPHHGHPVGLCLTNRE